jgi:hypothetical protein
MAAHVEGTAYPGNGSSPHCGNRSRYGEFMPQRLDVAEFLRTRRERITPVQAGLVGGGRRRVPGLRREAVASLAGVSVD